MTVDFEKIAEELEQIPSSDAEAWMAKRLEEPELLPYLFEVLNYVERGKLGVPMHQSDRADRAVPSRRPAGDVRDRGLPRSHHRRRQLRRARRKQHDADAHPGADPGSGDPSEEADLV